MEYTTDPSAAIEGFLAQKLQEANDQAANQALEVEKVKFCQEVRAAAGKDPDADLAKLGADADLQGKEAAAQASTIAAKMDTPTSKAVADTARAEWLAQWIASIEAEHAQHGVLIELAATPEQVESPTLAQIVIEGAHQAGLAELATLS